MGTHFPVTSTTTYDHPIHAQGMLAIIQFQQVSAHWQTVWAEETPEQCSEALWMDVAHIVSVSHVLQLVHGDLLTAQDTPILPLAFARPIITQMATPS